jgi:hypothetical protein
VRDLLQKHQLPIAAAVGLILVVALVVIFRGTFGGGATIGGDAMYFYDTGSGQLFEGSLDDASPSPGPSGSPAYRARAYGCGGGGDPAQMFGIVERGTAEELEVAAFDPSDSVELTEFVPAGGVAAAEYDAWVNERCGDEQQVELCFPE